MSRELRKFSSLEELNGFISEGKILYSLANSGNIWFVEYETTTPNTSCNTNGIDEFEAIIEKGIRLGYIEVTEFGGKKVVQVKSSRNLCSLAIGQSDIIKKQIVEYCYNYKSDYFTRRDLEEYVELKK